jgi:septum site-determining protein MinD
MDLFLSMAVRKNMKSNVIVVTSGKGGVGKTTAVANLGFALATMGRRIVVIDADVGLRNLDIILGLENRIVFHLVDVLKGRCKLKSALIRHKKAEKLFLLPASQTDDKDDIGLEDMKKLIYELEKEFDYVLIDSPAGIEHGFKSACVAAKLAIIVCTPDVSSVRDADRVVGLLQSQEVDTSLLINRINPVLVQRGEMLSKDDILDILGINLIGIVPNDKRILTSSNAGIPVVTDEESEAGSAFKRIASRLNGETVELVEPQIKKEGFFSRIGKKLKLSPAATSNH